MTLIKASKEHLSAEGAALVPIVPAGTLIMSFKLSIGRTAIAGVDLRTNEAIAAFTNPSEDVDTRYLGYVLQSHDWGKSDGANDKLMGITLNKAKLKDALVPLPPLDEQKRIVAKLDEISILLTDLSSTLDSKQAMSNSLVEMWRDRKLAAHSGDLVSLASRSEVRTGPFGSLLHKSDYVDHGVPIVNPINMIDGAIVPDKRIEPDRAWDLSAYRLLPGDIVVGRRGELGRCAVVEEDQRGWLCGTGSFFIRCGEGLLPEFVAIYLDASSTRNALESASSGSTMPNISNKTLGSLKVPNLQVDEQAFFIERWGEIQDLAREHEDLILREGHQLRALRECSAKQILEGAA